jgi:hypothetical protein
MKALALEPAERYKEVTRLSAEIRSYSFGFATKAQQAGFLTLSWLLIKRQRVIATLVLLFLLTATIAGSVFLLRLQEEKRIALNERDRAEGLLVDLEKEKNTVTNQRDRDEKLTMNFQAEKRLSHQVLKTAAQDYYQAAHYFLSRQDFGKASRMMEQVCSLDPDLQEAKLDLARLLFVSYRFKLALELANTYQGKQDINWLKELCDYALSKRSKNGLLPLPIFDEIYYKLGQLTPAQRAQMHPHLKESLTINYPVEQRLSYAKNWYKKQNKAATFTFELQKRGEFFSLSMRGNYGIHDLQLLRRIPFEELDLSYTDISDLDPLKAMPLKKLNLSYSRINDLSPLNNVPIEELYLEGSPVTKIQGCKSMPLKVLHLSDHWTALQSLKNHPTLEIIYLPEGVYSEKYLKQLGLLAKCRFRKLKSSL